jgi:hypothetical protein
MVRLPYFADPKNLEVEEDQPKKIEEGPEGETLPPTPPDGLS